MSKMTTAVYRPRAPSDTTELPVSRMRKKEQGTITVDAKYINRYPSVKGTQNKGYKDSLSLEGSADNMIKLIVLGWGLWTTGTASTPPSEAGEKPIPSTPVPASGTTSKARRDANYDSNPKRKKHTGAKDEEDSDGPSGTKRTKYPTKAAQDARLLACPFFKRDPKHFSRSQTCVGPGWPTVYRLKEHLLRKHAPHPFQCSRCFREFDSNNDLEAHQRAPKPCQVRERVSQPDKFNNEQKNELQKRVKGLSSQTEEAKWADVYKILFPHEEVPSPYYTYDVPAYDELLEFYEREFPPLVKHRLEEDLNLDQVTIDNVVKICLRSHSELQQQWNSSHPTTSLTTRVKSAKPEQPNAGSAQLRYKSNISDSVVARDISLSLRQPEVFDQNHNLYVEGGSSIGAAPFSMFPPEQIQNFPHDQASQYYNNASNFDEFVQNQPASATSTMFDDILIDFEGTSQPEAVLNADGEDTEKLS